MSENTNKKHSKAYSNAVALKKKYSSYNAVALRILQEKYGFTKIYIYQSITGDRVGTVPDKLKQEYYELKAKQEKEQEKFINANK